MTVYKRNDCGKGEKSLFGHSEWLGMDGHGRECPNSFSPLARTCTKLCISLYRVKNRKKRQNDVYDHVYVFDY